MQIKYEFVNGEKTDVEIDDAIGMVILDSRRIEANKNRRERYHCYSIEGADFEGEKYFDKNTPEKMFFDGIETECINTVLNKLSDVQRKRLLLFADGLSINEIARLEGICPNAAWKSIQSAKKKFIKNFSKMGV